MSKFTLILVALAAANVAFGTPLNKPLPRQHLQYVQHSSKYNLYIFQIKLIFNERSSLQKYNIFIQSLDSDFGSFCQRNPPEVYYPL